VAETGRGDGHTDVPACQREFDAAVTARQHDTVRSVHHLASPSDVCRRQANQHPGKRPVDGITPDIQAVQRRDRLRAQLEDLGFKAFPAAPSN